MGLNGTLRRLAVASLEAVLPVPRRSVLTVTYIEFSSGFSALGIPRAPKAADFYKKKMISLFIWLIYTTHF